MIRMETYFYDAPGEQYSYTNTYTMVYYAGFYSKFTFSGNNVTCYAPNTPTNLALPHSGCIVCDTSNYNHTLNIPSFPLFPLFPPFFMMHLESNIHTRIHTQWCFMLVSI